MGKEIIKKWEPDNFELELNTIWSFPDRGDWATHDGTWRGNWSPYIPRNIILRYSQSGDLVLDQFAGGGTTLVEAKLLNRNAIGVDVNQIALKRCAEKVAFEHDNLDGKIYLRKGDARALDFIRDESIDLICTHPPYADIIRYSQNVVDDLSLQSYDKFLYSMRLVAKECFRVLKKDKYCAILMGDIRKYGYVKPLSFEVMRIFENVDFRLKEIIIKEQHNCKATPYWSQKQNDFLMIAHEHLFVFRK